MNNLTTWCIFTGKVRMEWNLKNNESPLDLSGYEVYQTKSDFTGKSDWPVYHREWYNKILLKSKLPIENYDES